MVTQARRIMTAGRQIQSRLSGFLIGVSCVEPMPDHNLSSQMMLTLVLTQVATEISHCKSIRANMLFKKSDFAIAEVVVWDRGLSKREMCEASGYLLKRYQYQPYNYGDLEVVNAEINIQKY